MSNLKRLMNSMSVLEIPPHAAIRALGRRPFSSLSTLLFFPHYRPYPPRSRYPRPSPPLPSSPGLRSLPHPISPCPPRGAHWPPHRPRQPELDIAPSPVLLITTHWISKLPRWRCQSMASWAHVSISARPPPLQPHLSSMTIFFYSLCPGPKLRVGSYDFLAKVEL